MGSYDQDFQGRRDATDEDRCNVCFSDFGRVCISDIVIRSALGFTQSEELFLRSIEFAKTDVSDGDVLYVWVGFGLNRTARRRIFDWTLENWDYVSSWDLSL
jgi:hypothetical protein